MDHPPTPEMQETARHTSPLGVVCALAGTGKTACLRNYARAHPEFRILYTVFNRSMREEAEKRFASLPNVTISTAHALAWRGLGEAKYRDTCGTLRADDIRNAFCHDGESWEIPKAILDALRAFAQSDSNDPELFDPGTPESAGPRLVRKRFVEAWKSITGGNPKGLPVEHDFYLKEYVLSKPDLSRFDMILCDEAQDLSGCMTRLALRGKRALFAGDPFQQIYGWRGSVDVISALMGKVKTFELTRSFRCPESVARIANPYIHILNRNITMQGKGTTGKVATYSPGTTPPVPRNGVPLVIGRTNASLFETALALTREGRKLAFLGGFDSYGFGTIADIQSLRLGKHFEILDPQIRRFKSHDSFSRYVRGAEERDLMARDSIAARHDSEDLRKAVDSIRAATTAGTEKAEAILSTVHRAKGTQAESVVLLDDFVSIPDMLKDIRRKPKILDLPPSEIKLVYVALTRALESVVVPNTLAIEESMPATIRDMVSSGSIRLRESDGKREGYGGKR